MTKVSVIIPVYNVEKFLSKCLDSVINQTLKDIEIICVNDGSTDKSFNILKEYENIDSRIKIINQENKGVGIARNNGLFIANGEYVHFLDSDDYVSLNFYEEMYKTAKKYYSDIVVTDKVLRVNKEKNFYKKVGILANKSVLTKTKDRTKILLASGICNNKLYRLKFLKKNKIAYINDRIAGEDNYVNALTVINANRIAVNHNAILYYVNREDSFVNKLKTEKDFSIFYVYDEIEKYIIKNNVKKAYLINNNLRKLRDFSYYYPLMEDKIKQKFKKLAFQNCTPEIVVSITSYPLRIKTVNQTIETLLVQSCRPDLVILWLSEEEFPNKEKDLPVELLQLQYENFNFIIEWCNNIKSYKKLIPTLQQFPNSIIITADDDVLYNKDCVNLLLKTHKKFPRDVICHRTRFIKFDRNGILPYKKWKLNYHPYPCSYNYLFTGVGMVLYPKNCFYEDVLNENLFNKLCKNTDDIWFWAMCVLNNTKIRVAKNFISKLNYVENTQEVALWHKNVNIGFNDINIKLILDYYPKIRKKISKMTIAEYLKNIINKMRRKF